MLDSNRPFAISVIANVDQIPAIASFLEDAMQQLGLNPEKIFEVQVAVDEACTNIIQHSFPDRQDGKIDVSCDRKENNLIITIQNNGQPYNQTKTPPPDLTSALEDRRVGGLGVHFMKQFMDELYYELKDGTEIITMIKRVN